MSASSAASPREEIPGARRLAVERGRRRAVGVPALRHDLRQRLCAAADGPLPASASSASSRRRGFRGDLRLMHSAGGLVSPETARDFPDPPARKRPGRRRTRDRSVRRARRQEGRHLLRHGRHDREGLHDRGRPQRDRADAGGGPRASLHQGLRPADQGAGDRHDRDRRRRRLDRRDRRGRPSEGRPAFGRLRSGPGLLRHGRHEADRDRRQSRARLLRSGLLPRRPHDARSSTRRSARWRRSPSRSASRSEEAAWGIHKVVVESMAAAARVHLVEKGKDPRRYAMVGFGGAGPAHAADVARVLGVREVIIPPASGAASALGFLAAPLSFELVRSLPVEFSRRLRRGGDQSPFWRSWRRKAASASPRPASRRATSRSSAPPTCASSARCTTSPCRCRRAASRPRASTRSATAFVKAYSARYTSVYDGARMEAINFRVRCAGPTPKLSLRGAAGGGEAAAKIKGTRRAWFERRLRRGDGLRPLRAASRRRVRRSRHHRGARGDHGRRRRATASRSTRA